MKINQTRVALYAVCIARAGYVDGGRLIAFIEEWQRAVSAAGRAITFTEFLGVSELTERTAYRRLALFRRTFPQLGADGLPSDLMLPLLKRLEREVR